MTGARCRRATVSSTRDPVLYFFHSALALAQFHLGDDAASVQVARRAVSAKPRHFSMLVLLAGLGRLGLRVEAEGLALRARQISPRDPAAYWTLLFPYADPRHRADVEAGLAAAGL